MRLRAHHHHGSRGMLVRPGSAVFDPNSTNNSSASSSTTGNSGRNPGSAESNHEQIGR